MGDDPDLMSSAGFLLLDACVLIDYWESDFSVLSAVSRNVGPVVVTRVVLDDADPITQADLNAIGVDVIDGDLDLLQEASRGRGAVSFADRVGLLLARQRRWTCVTNDVSLRTACAHESVAVLWGLELMVVAVGVCALSPRDALTTAVAIHQANPLYVTADIVSRLAKKIGLTWPR